jgi:hypothetical protein
MQRREMIRSEGLVVVPPDLVFGQSILDHELVAGRTSGVLAGEYDQGTAPGQNTFLAGDRHLIKRWGREIAIDGLEVFKAMLFELRAKFRHSRPSSSHERGQEMFPFVSPQCGKLHVYFPDRAVDS